ncbi:hypothetical protein QAD02_010011 [Eretmocerus hayati]|uniref:Uncharacterized protein n=1 Tax=Eretmocerus hayati TaxID=131215 RepID=A0ACC2NB49_9HYME|nr:hypothetical protein QAD02_010011 [Eretmocerus hayati]
MLKYTPILITLLIGSVFSTQHNLEVGAHQPGDRLVTTDEVRIDANLIKKVVEEREFLVPRGYVITMVKATNLSSDDTGAEVVMLGGGPGSDRVRLRFKSQRFEGVYHRVDIFAKPY